MPPGLLLLLTILAAFLYGIWFIDREGASNNDVFQTSLLIIIAGSLLSGIISIERLLRELIDK